MTSSNKNSNHINNYGMANKTFNTYFLGFVLCIILTLIPFYAIIHSVASKSTLLIILFLSAIVQFFVQVTCFF